LTAVLAYRVASTRPSAREDLAVLLRFQFVPGATPGLETALQVMHVPPAVIDEQLRHTGAGCFMRSSAVGYGCRGLRQVLQVFCNFIDWNTHRSGQLLVRLAPRHRIARVDEHDLFVAIEHCFSISRCHCDGCHMLALEIDVTPPDYQLFCAACCLKSEQWLEAIIGMQPTSIES
jgi:hypothetical protein